MKSILRCGAAALALAGLSVMPAQAGPDEDAAVAVMETISKALTACAIDDFAGVLDPDGTIFPPAGQPLGTLKDDIAFWRDACAKGAKNEVSFKASKVEIYGNHGVVVGVHPDTVLRIPDQGEVSGDIRTTALMKKINGKWKLHHVHLSITRTESE